MRSLRPPQLSATKLELRIEKKKKGGERKRKRKKKKKKKKKGKGRDSRAPESSLFLSSHHVLTEERPCEDTEEGGPL